ncbi:indolepyruvate ferredoxin oxidoreductase family protein [Burkholderia lata]|uniref:indolepyruvate ferredoxin oxidoreductase family protein n=1 Tax=Burkholderia lata (strain ATCC 17760 / DSM 23089 / LMG 22485 / NCIMB 9086 / R18194 / 383) TaxID=482957 RepID=UPI00145374AB|nr:indolepyruvate ferredoxin oxidoreductase family protein [Burkholderia lata]VWB87637.1 MFS transporter [Burkholderia lata]
MEASTSTTLARKSATLEDRYTTKSGWVYLTGMQALVRLPLQQRQRDIAAGWNTGGYISGYRGSPMGRYDMELWAADSALKAANVVFRSGLNEDLAATAIWGSQYVGTFPGAKVDGVFGIWYGKGPGVDRSADALRHGNMAGTSPKGGVLCLAGDDHGAKSSTVANASDGVFIAVGMPVLYPSNTQEVLDYGLHGIAMSRFSGCWVGMKLVTDVVEGGGSVHVDSRYPLITLPEPPSHPVDRFGAGYHVRGFDMALPQEERLYHHKHDAAMAYARANGLNQIVANPATARVGVISAGKAWQDVQQACAGLGLSSSGESGPTLRLLKIGMVWPLDPVIVREFAQDLDVIVVVEEKRPVLEDQLRTILYGSTNTPRIIGKYVAGPLFDPNHGPVAFPNAAELSPRLVASVLTDVLRQTHPNCDLLSVTLPAAKTVDGPVRAPSFCSGCPHNRSTKVIEGSRALAGIGCHTMAMLKDPTTTTTTSHMGAEGVMWLGQQPFTSERHVFANMGDGTFAHSGLLAIRQAVAAKVPITYKLLFNGFVSMTGGQPVESGQTPEQILATLAGEGVGKMAVVTDEPHRYQGVRLPAGVAVYPRDQLQTVEREFREYTEVSVILYDQPCATERRRLRKRGKWATPNQRTFINAAVCEGCGDCGAASNCMSIEPLETELGRKRHINQASCNMDFSCVDGFCPSFVTVHGGSPRKPAKSHNVQAPVWTLALPEPDVPPPERLYSVLVGGIGGTGVVTIGQTLAMAAHIDGYYSSNLDVTGLAQKYGAVTSHVRLAPRPELLHATRIGAREADVMIGCDLLVAAGDESLSVIERGITVGFVSSELIPTSEFTRNPDWQLDAAALVERLRGALGERLMLIEAQRLAIALLGDPIAANMLLLGVAWQRGMVPVSLRAIETAIGLNGVAIAMNKEAFLWGRRCAHDLAAVQEHARKCTPSQTISIVPRVRRTLADLVAHRSAQLTAHTGSSLAARYAALVERVQKAESALGLGDALARAVAHNYHRVLAVKDEWEVARLYSDPAFQAALTQEFEGDYTLHFHIGVWPFARTETSTGRVQKGQAGPWLLTAMRWMARLKPLRNTWLDPFRRSADRVLDRELLAQYERDIDRLLNELGQESHTLALKIAALPESVRGFGHVRHANADRAAKNRTDLWEQWSRQREPIAQVA